MDWERDPRSEWELLAEMSKTGTLEIAGSNELLTLLKLARQGYVERRDNVWSLNVAGRAYFESLPEPAFQQLDEAQPNQLR